MAIGIDPVTCRVHGVHYGVVHRDVIARESLTNSSVELFVECAWRFHWVSREVDRLWSVINRAMSAHIYDDAPVAEFTQDDFGSPFDLVAGLLAWILRVDPPLAEEAMPTWKEVGEVVQPD